MPGPPRSTPLHSSTRSRPGIADFFRFIDVSGSHPFSGTGNLVKFAEGLAKIGDEGTIDRIVRETLAGHAATVAEYRAGKTKAFGFLVGQVMKASMESSTRTDSVSTWSMYKQNAGQRPSDARTFSSSLVRSLGNEPERVSTSLHQDSAPRRAPQFLSAATSLGAPD